MNRKLFAIVLTIALVCSFTSFTLGYMVEAPTAEHWNPTVSYNVFVLKDGVQIAESGNTITDIGETWLRSWVGLCGEDNTTARSAAQYISLSNDGSASAAWRAARPPCGPSRAWVGRK